MNQTLKIRDEAIAGLEVATRDMRVTEAKRLGFLARGYRALPPGEMEKRAYIAEAALAFGLSAQRVETLLGLALTLADEYVETGHLMRSGQIGLRHAEIITDAGRVITNITATGVDEAAVRLAQDKAAIAETRRQAYEHAVLACALELTPNRLLPTAKRLAEQWAVEPIEERHRRATRGRRVTIVALDDGMAELRAYMPAVQAFGVYDHLTRIGKAVKRKTVAVPSPQQAPQPGDSAEGIDHRKLDEIRADAFYQLLSRDPFDAADAAAKAAGAELQGRVQLVVTAEGLDALLARHGGTVVRDTGLPADGVGCELQGYGPIDIGSVRPAVASLRQWNLITVCPHTGTVIRTDTYRPSKSQERFLVARDGHCRFPGCVAPVHRSEIDHTVDAALGGPTATDNLAHLCLSHHVLKGNSDWTLRQLAGGVMEWTSPTERVYIDRPPDLLPERRAARPGQRSRVAFEPVSEYANAHPF
ncbi:MAG: HNH endonuclease [Leucobacter sp.]|nr:HNH endonuclease [Leucobacter sp.]